MYRNNSSLQQDHCHVSEAYNHYSTKMPRVMEGDSTLLKDLVDNHISKDREFNNLRSRWAQYVSFTHQMFSANKSIQSTFTKTKFSSEQVTALLAFL